MRPKTTQPPMAGHVSLRFLMRRAPEPRQDILHKSCLHLGFPVQQVEDIRQVAIMST